MSSDVGELRISGLVKLMNGVRDKLRAGIPEGDRASFRADVRRAVRTVERLCEENHTTPERLPVPSRRAYEYLRDLDLSRLPAPQGPELQDDKEFRLSGLVSTCDSYHRRFARAAAASDDDLIAEVRSLSHRLCTDAGAILALCGENGVSPAALPTRSRRAYQWLSFLCDAQHLLQHLQSLRYVMQESRRRLPAQGRVSRAPEVRIALTSMLYQVKAGTTVRRITIDEGFIGAPSNVLDILARLSIIDSADEEDRERLRAYADSPAYTHIHDALRATIGPAPATSESAKGLHHDLDVIFDRVNAAYFRGEMARPRLAWNRRHTYRKLAHYDIQADRVLVSITLDDPNVPDYALDFVMYHELLHKSLGTRLINGRRRVHTQAFREAERAFPHYDRARSVLDRLLKEVD